MFILRLFFATLFFDFLFRMRLKQFLQPFKRKVFLDPEAFLDPLGMHKSTSCAWNGISPCFGESPQPSEVFMLDHSHILSKQTWHVATEITCSSDLPVRSCNTRLNIFLQQVNIFAKGLEGKCMLSVIHIYMGINPFGGNSHLWISKISAMHGKSSNFQCLNYSWSFTALCHVGKSGLSHFAFWCWYSPSQK